MKRIAYSVVTLLSVIPLGFVIMHSDPETHRLANETHELLGVAGIVMFFVGLYGAFRKDGVSFP